jgi:protein-S-isoprenylcysteine O-methyltransferase Ste14
MTFSKRVFMIAGIWGLLIVSPLFFLFDTIGRLSPPAISHPEFYFGFVTVTLAWQIAFLVIGSDPTRYRLLMLPAIVEKLGYVAAMAVLFGQGRILSSQLAFAGTDFVLGVLFTIAFFKSEREPVRA